MAILDWPVAERPREKLLAKGAASLSDSELLAIILRVGATGKSAVDLARDVLSAAGGLRQLLRASEHELCQYPGLGPAKYVQLQAVGEISRRYFAEQEWNHKAVALTSTAAKRMVFAKLGHYQHEVFACLLLDSHNGLIRFSELFQGTIDAAPVYPRQVLQLALQYNAKSVIFSHNHPAGKAEPSQPDRETTRELVTLLNLVDIAVHDHLIVAGSDIFSFAEHGLI